VLEQAAGGDLLGHVGALLPVTAAICELDRREHELAGGTLDVLAPAAGKHRRFDHLVIDLLFLERALHGVTAVVVLLEHGELAPVQLDRLHGAYPLTASMRIALPHSVSP
jgi:hypothetical protein